MVGKSHFQGNPNYRAPKTNPVSSNLLFNLQNAEVVLVEFNQAVIAHAH